MPDLGKQEEAHPSVVQQPQDAFLEELESFLLARESSVDFEHIKSSLNTLLEKADENSEANVKELLSTVAGTALRLGYTSSLLFGSD